MRNIDFDEPTGREEVDAFSKIKKELTKMFLSVNKGLTKVALATTRKKPRRKNLFLFFIRSDLIKC